MNPQGIAQLGGAQMAPGQASVPQTLPPAQPKTPVGMTQQLETLPPQQLMAMFMNPSDTTPKWAVVSAYAEAVKKHRLQQAAQGQAAMQQNQAAQQQPPVALQVMSQAAAPQGGITQGFADGGLIGGEPTVGYDRNYSAMRAVGIDLSPYDPPEVRADKFRRFEEYQRTGVVPPAAPRAELPGAADDRAAMQGGLRSLRDKVLAPAGAAMLDVATLVPRGLMGAYNSTAVRGLRALGVPAAYLPDVYGNDFQSMTPFFDRLRQGSGSSGQTKSAGPPAPPGSVAIDINPNNPLAIPSIEAALREPNLPYVERVALQDTLARLLSAQMGRGESSGDTGVPGGVAVAAGAAAPFVSPLTGGGGGGYGGGGGGGGIASLRGSSPSMSPDLPAGYEALVREQVDRLAGQRDLPQSVLDARAGLAALERGNVQAQRDGVQALRQESEEAIRRAEALRNSSRFEDIQFIGQMLEGTRGAKRLGDALAGAASGAGRAEEKRANNLREAQKARREDQRVIRSEEAAGRQLEILAAQRRLAEQEGDMKRVADIDAKMAEIKLGVLVAKQSREDKVAEFGLKERQVGADEARAAAAQAAATNRGSGNQLTSEDIANMRLKVRAQLAKDILMDTEYIKKKTQAEKDAYFDARVEDELRKALQSGGITLPGAPAPTTSAKDPLGIR